MSINLNFAFMGKQRSIFSYQFLQVDVTYVNNFCFIHLFSFAH